MLRDVAGVSCAEILWGIGKRRLYVNPRYDKDAWGFRLLMSGSLVSCLQTGLPGARRRLTNTRVPSSFHARVGHVRLFTKQGGCLLCAKS